MNNTITQPNDFHTEIIRFMTDGQYQKAAEYALEYAEKLTQQTESLSAEDQSVLLEKSDCIASTYRDLLFLAASQQLKELHQKQISQITERKRQANESMILIEKIKNNVTEFIALYESLSKLFFINPTSRNFFNFELSRLKSFPNNESPSSKEQLLDDLVKLLERVEPTDNKPTFWRDRYQITGTRFKCERGYETARNLIEETKELLLQYEKLIYNEVISYQEIYWRCGTGITSTVLGIMEKISDKPNRCSRSALIK